jgi:hypothetical protein
MLKKARVPMVWALIGAGISNLLLFFGGVGGGFRVSSGVAAHATAGAPKATRL